MEKIWLSGSPNSNGTTQLAPGRGLAWYWNSTAPVLKPVLNQYRFQCWHVTDVQYRANTDGKLPVKLPFRAAPVVGHAYASTAPVLNKYRFLFQHRTDVQYRANTDGQLPIKLPSEAAPVKGRAHTSTAPVLNKYRFQCWHGTDGQLLVKLASEAAPVEGRAHASTAPVLNKYKFQYWYDTDVQYHASTGGQLPDKLPF